MYLFHTTYQKINSCNLNGWCNFCPQKYTAPRPPPLVRPDSHKILITRWWNVYCLCLGSTLQNRRVQSHSVKYSNSNRNQFKSNSFSNSHFLTTIWVDCMSCTNICKVQYFSKIWKCKISSLYFKEKVKAEPGLQALLLTVSKAKSWLQLFHSQNTGVSKKNPIQKIPPPPGWGKPFPLVAQLV